MNQPRKIYFPISIPVIVFLATLFISGCGGGGGGGTPTSYFHFNVNNDNQTNDDDQQTSGDREMALSGDALSAFSQQIRAQKQLFIIDACQSGGMQDMFAMRGTSEERALAKLSRASGIHIFASTQSDQYATEFDELGHGVFTYTLLQALHGEADGSPKDGRVTVAEMNGFLQARLPELTERYRGQAQFPVTFFKGQDFPIVVE